MYELVYTKKFLKGLGDLSDAHKRRVRKQLDLLIVDPHHPSLQTKKREGGLDQWQAKISHAYRLYFYLEGQVITLDYVGPHEK